MKQIPITLVILFSGLEACTWVKPTDAGARVVVAETFNVTHCTKLGTTTTRVKHQIGAMDRKKEKVRQELITLARNEAAVMGGDTIVARGPATEGSMAFDVYRCAD